MFPLSPHRATFGLEQPLIAAPPKTPPKRKKISYLKSHRPHRRQERGRREEEGGAGGWKQRQRGRESSHYFSLIAHEWPSWFPPLQPGTEAHYRQPPHFSQEEPWKGHERPRLTGASQTGPINRVFLCSDSPHCSLQLIHRVRLAVVRGRVGTVCSEGRKDRPAAAIHTVSHLPEHVDQNI